jgi:valyl-tRNA synthetase
VLVVEEGLRTFNFAVCHASIHRFVVADLCDRYIELAKPILGGAFTQNACSHTRAVTLIDACHAQLMAAGLV